MNSLRCWSWPPCSGWWKTQPPEGASVPDTSWLNLALLSAKQDSPSAAGELFKPSLVPLIVTKPQIKQWNITAGMGVLSEHAVVGLSIYIPQVCVSCEHMLRVGHVWAELVYDQVPPTLETLGGSGARALVPSALFPWWIWCTSVAEVWMEEGMGNYFLRSFINSIQRWEPE